jgi:hypothetical protein
MQPVYSQFDWPFFSPFAVVFASLVLFSCCVNGANRVIGLVSRPISLGNAAPLKWEQEKTPRF